MRIRTIDLLKKKKKEKLRIHSNESDLIRSMYRFFVLNVELIFSLWSICLISMLMIELLIDNVEMVMTKLTDRELHLSCDASSEDDNNNFNM